MTMMMVYIRGELHFIPYFKAKNTDHSSELVKFWLEV